MDASVLIEDGVLVGVVSGAGLYECGNESGLAGEASSWNDDRPTAPADNAGMNEYALPAHFGNVNGDMRLERVVQEVFLPAAEDSLAVLVQIVHGVSG